MAHTSAGKTQSGEHSFPAIPLVAPTACCIFSSTGLQNCRIVNQRATHLYAVRFSADIASLPLGLLVAK